MSKKRRVILDSNENLNSIEPVSRKIVTVNNSIEADYDSDVWFTEIPFGTNIDLFNLTGSERKIQETISEFINTEQKHVGSLKILKYHFHDQIKQSRCLDTFEMQLLFPNLDVILKWHSDFNSHLKNLRKCNSLIPILTFLEIVSSQFEGANGIQYQNACASFCKNHSDAVKFLQKKALRKDEFSIVLQKCESQVICGRQRLADYMIKEVQRVSKYETMLDNLVNNIESKWISCDKSHFKSVKTNDFEDEEINININNCIMATQRVTNFVNKAVLQCDNRKLVSEISQRLDTSSFDAQFSKTPFEKYKYLDIQNKELTYSGPLDCKIGDTNISFSALLFFDMLVFIDRISTDEHEPERYVLKPLTYKLKDKKFIFSPVIPVNCIYSCDKMERSKRDFYLVVILPNDNNAENKKISTQLVFILTALSDADRDQWIFHLNKYTKIKKIAII